MAKAKKDVVPFFKFRHQANDTLEALSHELLMTLQVFQMILRVDSGLSPPARASIQERADALRKMCTDED